MGFLSDAEANSPAKYRFQLLNPESSELITLENEPLEWEDGIIELNRPIEEGGVYTNFLTDSLTFIKEGAKFLRDIWDEKEVNGRCYLIISWFKFSTHSYVEMPARFSLNFATCKPNVKVGNQSIGFLINTVKEDILVILENRKDVKVDITKSVSVGGVRVQPYFSLKKNVVFGETNQSFQTIWVSLYSPVTGDTASGNIENNDDRFIYTQFQMNYNADEFQETNEVDYQTDISVLQSVDNFFSASLEERDITFYYTVTIEVTNRKGNFFNPQNVYKVFFDVLDGSNIISSQNIGECGGQKGTFTFNGAIPFTLATGQSMRVYIRTDAVDNVTAAITYSYFRIKQPVAVYNSRTREGFPIYEVLERNLQLILDSQFPFYSEFFGRTDTPYNQNGDTYATEDDKRFAHIFSGLNLRGAVLFDPNNPLAISFKDLYKTINSIWNIGRETETIDNFPRIRIENYDYFFENVEALDLSDRIKSYDIEKEAMPDLAYSIIMSGYKDFDYESINGRGEFNTDSERTTILKTDSEFDNVSPVRADTKGITEKLINELDTTDTEEDNSLFILKTQRGVDWVPEKQENITIVEDTSLFGEDTFNLYFTPTRNLIRHMNRIKGAFIKFKSSKLRFQNSSKLQTLKTSGEGYEITENDDISVFDEVYLSGNGIYKPIKYTVTCPFTLSDLEALMANKKGFITLSANVSGYLLNLKKRNNEDVATIEIIEKA